MNLPYINIAQQYSNQQLEPDLRNHQKIKYDSHRLIERSMGRANNVMDRNVKAWLTKHQSISLPQIDRPYIKKHQQF